ncbi:cysteine dioxygenase type 1-like [Watersipora subatra]|uniref:cysteine dioxygenase type 1-like n=1 Tax=Watersipora subatra TaxID=2589382 RepID=UPI00355C379C
MSGGLCKVRPAADFDELVERLHEVFESDEVDIDYVKELMTSYKSNPDEWIRYAQFDKYRYTRNLVDEGNEKFNLIVLCWNEGQGSSIHDHANAHCFMKVLEGELQEVLFDWPSDEGCELVEKGTTKLAKDECAYICDDIGIHRVENTSFTDKAVSLHLYCPPFDECASFDQRTGHKNMCRVTFYSKQGQRTPFKPMGTEGGEKGDDINCCYRENN